MNKRFLSAIALTSVLFFDYSGILAQDKTEPEKPFNIFDEAEGKALRWRLNPGDVIEVKKISKQHVVITENRRKKQVDREVIHWITLNTLKKDNEKGYLVEGSFSSQIRYFAAALKAYEADELFFSSFYIQPGGHYLVDEDKYMPNVRHIPEFPDDKDPNNVQNPLKTGDQWMRPAQELYAGDQMYRIPMEVSYEYLGESDIVVEGQNRQMHKIRIRMSMNHTIKNGSKNDPVNIFGFSHALLAWDVTEGIPYVMKESTNLTIIYASGVTHEFTIDSVTYYNKKKSFSVREKDKLVKKLKDATREDKGTKITKSEKGVKIELPDVFFDFDSDRLTAQSRQVLNKVLKVLEAYPDKRILIQGHTDNVGAPDYNYELSRQRAYQVLQYLLRRTSVLKTDNFSYRGLGADEPAVPNDTPDNRRKNRRVEIIILDN